MPAPTHVSQGRHPGGADRVRTGARRLVKEPRQFSSDRLVDLPDNQAHFVQLLSRCARLIYDVEELGLRR